MNRNRIFNLPSGQQAHLGLIFLVLCMGMIAFILGYWLLVMEPRLKQYDESQAAVLAQSHAHLLGNTLLKSPLHSPQQIQAITDDLLVLTEPQTGQPYIEGITIELSLQPNEDEDTFTYHNGNTDCQDCIVIELPLFAPSTRELLGVATFYANNAFFAQLKIDVRQRLYAIMLGIALLLSAAWWVIHRLLERIHYSDRSLAQVFDAVPNPLLIFSQDRQQLLRTNQIALGYMEIPDSGSHYQATDLFAEEQDFEVLEQSVAMRRNISSFECLLRGKNGRNFWAILSCTAVDYENTPALLLSITDITLFKQAENAIRQSEERFATVVDSLEDLIYVADMNTHRILFMNMAMRKRYGNRGGELCWKVFYPQFEGPCPTCSNNKLLDETGQPNGIYSWEYQNPNTGEWYSCRDRAIHWIDGRIVRMEAATNTTELKAIQQELVQARDRAEAASRAKSNFLATMSHEIRTPMNGIIGTLELLQRDDPRPDQQSYIDDINHSSRQLLLLVNDILDLSRIEAGKLDLHPAPLSLDELLDDCLHLLDHAADRKGIQLQRECDTTLPPCVVADATRLRQVLVNLLSNAVKFTEHGQVTLRSQVLHIDTQKIHLQLSVSDTGIGIADEMIEQIFEAFTQLDNGTTRRHEGTGLGLAICQHLVKEMGGKICLASSSPQGSIFSMEISLELCTEVLSEEVTPPPLITPRRVLLAEDNHINSRVAIALLEQSGHHVDWVENGQDAVARLEQYDYDIVLMDLHMPEMDGIEATRRIRALGQVHKANIPVIALTANVMQEERQRCEEVGMSGFVSKPFSAAKLEQALQEASAKVRGE